MELLSVPEVVEQGLNGVTVRSGGSQAVPSAL